jgi:epoxyqueuosine reductase
MRTLYWPPSGTHPLESAWPPFPMDDRTDTEDFVRQLRLWAQELGFQQLGVSGIDLAADERHLAEWLQAGWHGDMRYMQRHGLKRARPAELRPGTLRVVSVRMDYWPADARDAAATLGDPGCAYVSRYALGRDYHKVLRRRLAQLARRMTHAVGPFGFRVFVDSAPVLEKALARNGGLGWIGKHTNLIHRRAGSWFFLGEIYTDLPLPVDTPAANHCGTCRACIDVCPTRAIVGPYRLDARRCISYLTIEHAGSIAPEFRRALGNRIYGCDDCQLVCPWNKFARVSAEPDFRARHGLDHAALASLFAWSADDFRARTEGSAIRRIGYQRWLRNIAVALGNAPSTPEVLRAIDSRLSDPSELVREHAHWARAEHAARAAATTRPPAG